MMNRLRPQSTALVLIDIQGQLAQVMIRKEELFRNIIRLVQGATILGVPVLWLEQYPQGLGRTVPEIAACLDGIAPIEKNTFSAWGAPQFQASIKELHPRHVLICGIETHICVYQTAVDLLQEQYQVEVVADAVSSRTESNIRIGIDKMVSLGARITSVEMALFELLQVGEGQTFRKILKIIK